MEQQTRYNGFTNYETWTVSLWLGNEYRCYQRWKEIARHAWKYAQRRETDLLSTGESAACALAKHLKEEIEDGSPLTAASLYSDLLRAALSEVDWYEIAENLIEDAREEDRP